MLGKYDFVKLYANKNAVNPATTKEKITIKLCVCTNVRNFNKNVAKNPLNGFKVCPNKETP